ncbi:hypothetical protein [Ramlibacter sp. Leaf400]|uniref:hypothetical protein n=1 Tax=Ramlibacter sp. Leaf400 TaxID=1736365 RepID=UPI0006F355E1|nr:hypothetical protein [Ramlibacter sp. Leaf400]KQT12148.1 hypothetical protein ASG30_02250 [Ramlibacter sp. Leaf400]
MPDNRTDLSDPAQASERPEGRPGNTTPAQGEDQRTVPRMPHERDESADSQPSSNASHARVGRKASADVERGVADTTKGAELDATYDKLRENLPDGEKKYRP